MFRNYVLLMELAKKANRTPETFYSSRKMRMSKMGFTTLVSKDNLQGIYFEASKDCLDLKYYWTYAFFCDFVSLSNSYLSVLSKKGREIDHVVIGRNKLIKLSDEFIELIETGMTPYFIGSSAGTDKDYEKIIYMQGFKIGFY